MDRRYPDCRDAPKPAPSLEPGFRRSMPERRCFVNLMAVTLERGNQKIRLPLTRINVASLREAKNLHTTVRPSRTARKAKRMSHAKAQRKRKKAGWAMLAGSQAPACSLTVTRGGWSFKDRIPKLELGNEQTSKTL